MASTQPEPIGEIDASQFHRGQSQATLGSLGTRQLCDLLGAGFRQQVFDLIDGNERLEGCRIGRRFKGAVCGGDTVGGCTIHFQRVSSA